MIARIRSSLAILALATLVACAGSAAGPALVTNVWAEPGSGFVTVRWELEGAADRFEVFRSEVGEGGDRVAPFEPIVSIEDESARSFDDVYVEPGIAYTYAVAADDGLPVDHVGGAVRPERGNQLQILFTGPVPAGVSVRSEPVGIDCATAGAPGCTAEFAAILDVALSVEASADVPVGWEGCDSSRDDTCIVSMAEARAVTVSVESVSHPLEVEVDAPGMGRVTNVNDLGANPVVDCSDTCTYVYPDGLMIGLRATPIAPDDHRFASWSGACVGATGPSCTVTMDEAKSVHASFEVIPPEIASFAADPDRIWPHETATLFWSVSGGGEVRVSIEPDVGDVTGRTEVEVSPDETTVYTLTASNDGGTVTASTRVHVRLWPFGSLGSGADAP